MTLQERLRERLDIVEGDLVLTQKVKDSAMDELAKARARLDALERERDEYKMAAEAEANFADQYKAKCAALEREKAALRKDAERWRYSRKALLWAPSGDGEVKWVMFLAMPEPDVSGTGLTPDSVAQELDAAIDAAMAQRIYG